MTLSNEYRDPAGRGAEIATRRIERPYTPMASVTSKMTDKRDRFYGDTVEERIAKIATELARDAIGLWQIVSFGREGFALSGTELVDFVRRSLLELFARGAKPVTGSLDNVHIWTPLKNYGDTPEEMSRAIIDEWQRSGRDPDFGGVWFAVPQVYEEKRTASMPAKHG